MQPREKALQAAAEKVSYSHLGTWQGYISEANSEAVDLSTFKVTEDISTVLSLVEKATAVMNKLEPGRASGTLHMCLRRATRFLNSTWDHTQVASFANAGISYASMATVDVGTRAVQSGLRSLWAQALRVRTCTLLRQADQLLKHADSLPHQQSKSLWGGLDYHQFMAQGFVQAGLDKPRPPNQGRGRDNRKRKQEDSSPPFRARDGTTGPPRRRGSHFLAEPRGLSPSPSKGTKPSAGQRSQPKGKTRGGRGRDGQESKTLLGAQGPRRISRCPGMASTHQTSSLALVLHRLG